MTDDNDDEIFKKSITNFLNDTTTHPILKYKMFIILFILIFVGLIVLFIIHAFISSKPITGHSYWKHLFVTPTMDNYDFENDRERDDLYDYTYSNSRLSSAAIFRKAIEGFDTKTLPPPPPKEGDAKSSADVEGAKQEKESKKTTPCSTDCGQYVSLQGKINTLAKMVDEVKAQKDKIKQVGDGIQAVGVQIKNLSKSLAPSGKFKAKLQ